MTYHVCFLPCCATDHFLNAFTYLPGSSIITKVEYDTLKQNHLSRLEANRNASRISLSSIKSANFGYETFKEMECTQRIVY